MDRTLLVVLVGLALLAAGCVGSQGSDGEDVDASEGTEPSGDPDSPDGGAAGNRTDRNATPDRGTAGNATDGPEPINRTYEDAGTAGVLLVDPGQSLGAKTTFAQRSYDNGLNGTWVIGYEVEPAPGHESLTVETTAEPVDPLGEIPEYDLFVYGPDGEVVASSFEGGSDEQATVTDLAEGTYLALLYYQEGADNPITTHVVAR